MGTIASWIGGSSGGFASGRLLLVRGMDAEDKRHREVLERPPELPPYTPKRAVYTIIPERPLLT